MIDDKNLIQAALMGYQQRKAELEDAIASLQKRLGVATVARKKHRISLEGRARIAAAQRKRWKAAKSGSTGR